MPDFKQGPAVARWRLTTGPEIQQLHLLCMTGAQQTVSAWASARGTLQRQCTVASARGTCVTLSAQRKSQRNITAVGIPSLARGRARDPVAQRHGVKALQRGAPASCGLRTILTQATPSHVLHTGTQEHTLSLDLCCGAGGSNIRPAHQRAAAVCPPFRAAGDPTGAT